MAIFNIFKEYKPRRSFTYKPLYYNEDKENLEERKRKIEQEVALNRGVNLTYQSGLQKGYLASKRKTSSSKVSTVMFFVALAAVVVYCCF